jgi:predicted GNAT family N-acyltransferase
MGSTCYPSPIKYGNIPMHKIIVTNWPTHSHELAHIRTEVFIKEQQVPLQDEWDGKDETATHFLVQSDTQAIGCARLLVDELNQIQHFHIGRVAMLRPFRAQGIGQQLMNFILAHCAKTAPYPIYLHAQINRQAFYEHLGFISQGPEFLDAGIPHISMFYR